MRTITLTTDFGTRDGYVAAMKGVVLNLNPGVTIVDVTHDVPPQAIQAGGFALMNAAPYFPRGTIHVVVVDPGVGGPRRPIALERDGQIFIGPDNGLLPLAAAQPGGDEAAWHVVHLTERRYWRPTVSQTFHGRDIFAPVAAHLSLGVPVTALGSVIRDYVNASFPLPRADGRALAGEIVHIDHFGNCISNIAGERVPAAASVRLGERVVSGVRRTYADGAPGEVMALVGSTGYLEIAVREGDAARTLNAQVGDAVYVE